jgi:hypothetical protein
MGRVRYATVAVAALVAAAGAAASVTARDAKSLALRPADFPATAKRMSEKENRSAALPGGTGQAYTTTFQFRVGGRTEAIGTIVITAPSAAVARRVYAAAVADARKSAVGALRLPRLGGEQYAALHGRPAVDETSGLVWVRTNTVVWHLQATSVRNPFGFSRAEAQAELTRYALKQMRRIGTG